MYTACTICACNYLAYARVLAESFHRQHPDGTFVVLLIDDERAQAVPGEGRIVWRRLRDIGLDEMEIRRLAAIYDVRELSTAVKPLLLRHLLDAGAEAVIYLDPDIRIYDSLAAVWSLAAQHAIVLTPHTMQPYPRDGSPVNSFYILAAGVYNLGFIGVGAAARPFLDWWWQGTRREALADVAKMMFTDQRWIDFVPSFFEPHILKDPGCNVAYWNLHARALALDGDRYTVDGVPLRFFHFSGFDVDRPWLLSRHQGDRPRVLLSDRPPLRRICDEYRVMLLEAGIGADAARPYVWGTLPSGVEFTEPMRRLYRSALIEAEAGQAPEPPDPFDETQPAAFLAWLNAPEPGGPRRVSRYLYQLYRSRLDLQIHFRDIHGGDAPRYLDWIWQDGVVQARIPPELLPERRAGTTGPGEPLALEEGLNIGGYFRAELGIGEAARLLVSAVEAARIPYSTITTDTGAMSRQAHEFGSHPDGVAAYDINLVCVNADMTPRFIRDMGPDFTEGRHTVGYWFWEVERFPSYLHAAFDAVDEVWTATDFVAEAVRSAGRKPVFTIPVPLTMPRTSPDIDRRSLGLPERFLFLFSFDFLSIFERKNPVAVVRAFARAFEPGQGPALLIKSINGHLRVGDLERLRTEIGDRPDIQLVDGYYTAAEKNALVGLCDCYVSLHRSEGLGLTMAEAMVAGKPVIATGYSGNMHFMTSDNSFLVDHVLTKVPADCQPYPEGAAWADPDVDHATRLMQNVYGQPQEAAARGQRARGDILRKHGVDASAAAIARRLESIRRDRRARIAVPVAPSAVAPPPPAPPPPPAAAPPDAPEPTSLLEATLAHIDRLATPRITVEGRGFHRTRRAAQVGLFRVMRPFWFQHQQLHGQLVDVLLHLTRAQREEREARSATERRLERLESAMASATGEVGRVERELGQAQRDADQALYDRALRVNRDVQELNARLEHTAAEIRRVSDATAGLSGLTQRVARLGALEGRVEQTAAGLAELRAGVAELAGSLTEVRAFAASLQAEGTARQETIASLTSELAGLRISATLLRKDAAARLSALTALTADVENLRTSSAQSRDQMGTRIAALAQTAAETGPSLESLVKGAGDIDRRVGALEPGLQSLRAESGTWVTNVARHLEGLTQVVGKTEKSLATLERRLFAVPYMADPDHFRERDEQGLERLGYGSTNGATGRPFYVGFEDLFRGPQTLIRDRQSVYLPLLRHASQVVDIGCGRGEMLDLLETAGTPATGVDIDPDMVAICRAKGHRVEQIDAVQFLRDRGERSLDGIFSAQVIEHLTFDQLKAFLTLCRSRLKPGGTAIVETVNPHALEAFKTFYTDLTHQRPIFPEVALALIQLAGFSRAYVVFPQGKGSMIENRQTQGEYAVVATVDAADEH
jgi:2-polyprenyl-3-methyl-5-hydroxy-6-metoxy-1,4-benzoquinol methylase/glycosyltransferase involved in cell wall biosynthesis